MSYFENSQRAWDDLASRDPMYVICSDTMKAGRKWDRDEFFQTGRIEVNTVMQYLGTLNINTDCRGRALDFGCGVGRLTQALTSYFDQCIGIDISACMVSQATEWNKYPDRCRYVVNATGDLKSIREGPFAFIYTSIVLQHIAPPYASQYVAELIRLLQPGGVLVFQIPDRWKIKPATFRQPESNRISLLHRIRAKAAVRSRLRRMMTARNDARSARLVDSPQIVADLHGEVKMYSVSENEVNDIVIRAGARVRDVRFTNSTALDFNGKLAYLDEEPEEGLISKQYCVVR